MTPEALNPKPLQKPRLQQWNDTSGTMNRTRQSLRRVHMVPHMGFTSGILHEVVMACDANKGTLCSTVPKTVPKRGKPSRAQYRAATGVMIEA